MRLALIRFQSFFLFKLIQGQVPQGHRACLALLKSESKTQCKLFSMPQCERTA